MDFSQLPLPQMASAPTDPFKIFSSLPRLSGAPNDLWRGQAEALTTWNENRTKSDVLLSLNTGAGKTIVGLLIAKSLVNEGLENVIYVCPTNDLVRQTATQAAAIGIEVTTRTEGGFSNDLFESGKTFCITNYAAVFNGLSALRRRFFPQAIIFDDAHVAEATMRDAFTIGVERKEHEGLFDKVAALYLPHFRNLNREQQYAKALSQSAPLPDAVLVPPDIVRSTAAQLSSLLISGGVPAAPNLKYAYEHLKDHLDRCAVVFRSGKFEITPPFLPSLAVDVFDRRVRRIYLSATLHNKADIVRAFGRAPELVVEPSNDAGNGERLILVERDLESNQKFDAAFARKLTASHKVLVAIPGYHKVNDWKALAEPAPRDQFSEKLDAFRKAQRGAFVLVSRVDGIDLPNDTCRLMIIDGLPRGESLLEKYQFEYLHMHNFAASRMANRLVQLFGRINRGRSDYGAFLIAGHDLNIWLNNDRSLALLPNLLKNQVLLGRSVQKGMGIKSLEQVEGILATVLLSQPRDQSWLDYYSRFLDAQDVPQHTTDRARKAEERNLEAAKAEALYAKHIWEGNFQLAREALDVGVADLARSDEKLAGWHNLWIGACLHLEGRPEDARYYYSRARGQLGLNLIVEVGSTYGVSAGAAQKDRIVGKLYPLLSLSRESFEKQLARLERELAPLGGGTSGQMEEATRQLGEYLGFESSRPDNEFDTGPDVLWHDLDENTVLGLELKTDKGEDSAYSKDDVSQSLDHLEWIKSHSEGRLLGVTLVGPSSAVSTQANPSDSLFGIGAEALIELRDRLISIIRDGYQQPGSERLDWLERSCGTSWRLSNLADVLCGKQLKAAGA